MGSLGLQLTPIDMRSVEVLDSGTCEGRFGMKNLFLSLSASKTRKLERDTGKVHKAQAMLSNCDRKGGAHQCALGPSEPFSGPR